MPRIPKTAAPVKPPRRDNPPSPRRASMRDWKRTAAGKQVVVPQPTNQTAARMDSSTWGTSGGHRGGARLVQHRTRVKARSGGGIDRSVRTPAAETNRARNRQRRARGTLMQSLSFIAKTAS